MEHDPFREETNMKTIVLRLVDEANAATLGYELHEYAGGRWVVESGGGWWIDDLPADLREVDYAQAQRLAVDAVSDTYLDGDGVSWVELPGNYGTAYEGRRALHLPTEES